MAYEFIETRRDGPVERLTLNRPDVRNAFNERLIEELTRWAETAAADGDIRVAILAGAGRAFCAGADLAWMRKAAGFTRDENVRDAAAMARMYAALDTLPVPLVGRVHGAALGGGVGLLGVCDMVVADTETVFGFTEVKLGIIPAVITPYVLPKIGLSAARELFLTGARFGAARAREIGLVHAVADAQQLDGLVDGYVRELLTAAPGAIAAAKELIGRVRGRAAADVAGLTAEALAARRVSTEGQEGLTAFLEKRKASWHVPSDSDRQPR